ncbi:DsbA family protein [Rhodospirillum centenum]|uniref:Protein-disulfide isomerase, putative n=1 Tax=Rhodospirillum centenum (strain ATCC 51521 / SW) TaxID=414684 RepID=B6IR59_RHOCS|nr:DsbA family protein [Rhodospirillum centenum]ACI97945.1 protein-disulfide isomerase, putative [Rhodospirillum centenum SW]
MRQNLRSTWTRRGFLGALALAAGIVALPLLAGPSALAQQPASLPGFDLARATEDKVIGDPKAPITIIEYASLTCSHCAHMHTDILPRIKAEFIDTGQAKLIFRDFPMDQVALTASMFSRCVAPERYFSMLSALFKSQKAWFAAKDPLAEVGKTARMAGLTPEQQEACLSNKQLETHILQTRLDGIKKYNISGTPTLILNDGAVVIDGAREEELINALVKLGAKRKAE